MQPVLPHGKTMASIGWQIHLGFGWNAHLRKLDTKAVTSLLESWFNNFGWLTHIRKDGESRFRSEFKDFCSLRGSTHELSSPYNPEEHTNSQMTMAKHTTEAEDSSDQYSISTSPPQLIGAIRSREKKKLTAQWTNRTDQPTPPFIPATKKRRNRSPAPMSMSTFGIICSPQEHRQNRTTGLWTRHHKQSRGTATQSSQQASG